MGRQRILRDVVIRVSGLNEVKVSVAVEVCDCYRPEMRHERRRRLKGSVAIAQHKVQIVTAAYPSAVGVAADEQVQLPVVIEIPCDQLLGIVGCKRAEGLRLQVLERPVAITKKNI